MRTVSNYAKNFLLERVPGLDPGKMHVIHSSVPTDTIPKLEQATSLPFHVLYVGSLQFRKGVDILLKALGALPFPVWRCTIAGDGPDRKKLEALSGSLGLSGRVAFIGKQDFASVSDLYASASVVAVPSIIGPKGRTEGIPNVAIEALAFQRPVISTNVSGIPELIRERRTGRLLDPGSVEQLTAAIAEIHADPEGAHKMAVAGRKFVDSEFCLTQNACASLSCSAGTGRARRRKCRHDPAVLDPACHGCLFRRGVRPDLERIGGAFRAPPRPGPRHPAGHGHCSGRRAQRGSDHRRQDRIASGTADSAASRADSGGLRRLRGRQAGRCATKRRSARDSLSDGRAWRQGRGAQWGGWPPSATTS